MPFEKSIFQRAFFLMLPYAAIRFTTLQAVWVNPVKTGWLKNYRKYTFTL
jgi:hypothetical protein